MKTLLPDRQKNIVQWVSQATGINTLGVKIRLRGNDLHILCESVECPQRWHTLMDLLKALQQTDLDALTSHDSNDQPSVYQVFVYGRKKSSPKPEWCHRVYLNQLDRHLEQVNQALIRDQSKQPPGALIVSNESLARQGDPEALARYLSETLSTLGISVQVKVKSSKPRTGQLAGNSRLWILCRASYSPDPSIFAEPVAQKLRHLKLSGYQDAIIASIVQGETKPDWMLRIDLTPPEVMLKEWARWGDVQAIALYVNEKLNEKANTTIQVTASLKELTLHIFCSSVTIPDRQLCMETIGTILEDIAPQAIYAATIYGQPNNAEQPAWIDWLVLPAQNHPPLAISPLELASSADEPAIIFLLERLLNPDLNRRLQTGGIRILLLRKGDLMHVMCDAPVCPTRKQVAGKVIQLLRQLQIPGIKGVRVYGRRAGNKEPLWHHGADYQVRQRLVAEPTPEFAVTDAYVRELLPGDSNESLLRPDLTVGVVQSFVSGIAQDWGATAKKSLLLTQLFMEIGQPTERTSEGSGRLVAFVWGTLGLLLAFQTDWILNRFVSQVNVPTPTAIGSVKNASTDSNSSAATFTANNSDQAANSAFNASAFTQTNDKKMTAGKATATAILLAARGQMPTFNARQLDEQLALYKQRLQKSGKPPDVLVIGSSRGLRGVDPVALSKALATQGYQNIDIFNFGINGATVQVVDFILRKVLQPSELPKMVIWADGARAFNSGREDMTFRAIAASPGYKQALDKYIAQGNVDETAKPQEEIKKDNSQQETSYQAANKWLNQNLAGLSGTYQHRDQLKSLINQKLKTLPMMEEANPSNGKTNSTDIEQDAEAQSVDFDGFLALSTKFDPTTYYQKHPKVGGDYDNDYKLFQLAGDQDAALQNILQFAQVQKISLVFVNMPLTSEYLDPIRVKHEQEFQQYMLQISAERPNFIFRDLSLLFPQNNAFFSDPSHLNRYGAYEVSKKIAKDPMIPWANKKVSNSDS